MRKRGKAQAWGLCLTRQQLSIWVANEVMVSLTNPLSWESPSGVSLLQAAALALVPLDGCNFLSIWKALPQGFVKVKNLC